MRPPAFTSCNAGLGLWTLLAVSACGESSNRATRADCEQVAEHIANLIIADATANPEALWDKVDPASGEAGIPAYVTKPLFKDWLKTAEGQTWMMQRRGQTLTGTQQAIEPCVKTATKAHAKCLLASTSKADVDACDKSAK